MTFSFDLVDRQWIPCIRNGGTRDELSLSRTLAEAHNLREIHTYSPLETAALYRFLLAVLHRVFGPKNRAGWVQLWEARQFDATSLDEYLDEWKQRRRFDLFDDKHPFYQIADETTLGKPGNLNKMIHHVASGVTATLFDHHLDTSRNCVTCTPAEAARILLATQSFALGYQKFTDAPCAKGAVFFVQGETLFQTLMLNLVRYPDEGVMPSDTDDSPTWEMDDPFEPERSIPKGYLDYLTWQNRRIKLLPEHTSRGIVVRKTAWAPGLRLDNEVLDPMKHYRKSEEGWSVLSFSDDKALWRDSATLFQLSNTEDRTLKMLGWVSLLTRHQATALSPVYRLMALGMAKYRAKVEFLRSELTPLPLDYLKEERGKLVSRLSQALEAAEKVGVQLRSAVFTLARLILKPATTDKDLEKKPGKEETNRITSLADSWGVERYYWSGLELHFHRLVKDLPNDSLAALDEWHEQLCRAANYAFERAEAYAGQDRRTQRAIAKAREQFDRGLARISRRLTQKEGGNA